MGQSIKKEEEFYVKKRKYLTFYVNRL